MFGVVGFLIVGFNIVWNIKMYYKVDVWFVNVYFEGYCCYYDLQIVVLEFFLYFGVYVVFQIGMVSCCVNIVVLQSGGGVFYF